MQETMTPVIEKSFKLQNLGCANCAQKMETAIGKLDGVHEARVTFATQKLTIKVDQQDLDAVVQQADDIVKSYESDCFIVRPDQQESSSSPLKGDDDEDDDLKSTIVRIVVTLVVLIVVAATPLASALTGALEAAGVPATISWAFGSMPLDGVVRLVLFLIPYLMVGFPVLREAVVNISHGKVFDENFLMCVATIGALCLGEYPEAVGVMVFYSVGECFEDYAVGKSRKSIAHMMDIAPEIAHVKQEQGMQDVDPAQVAVGDVVVVKVGERVPLDGVVVSGDSQLNTAALTGESLPRGVHEGDEVLSGTVNETAVIEVRVTHAYSDSTVARILDLVENAADKKARSEAFITRFARYYTPVVCLMALLLAVAPPLLFAQDWGEWIERGLIFLMVSCPCALVISVPLGFFGGIGAASRYGVLVKGSNYLEALAQADTVVFDKTGTLTRGVFSVVAVHPETISEDELLRFAAYAEAYSNHPIAASVRDAYGQPIDIDSVQDVSEAAGHGVQATVEGRRVVIGNEKLMSQCGVCPKACELEGTELHVAIDNTYVGHIIIADVLKADSSEAIAGLKQLGVRHTVMLTGDHKSVADSFASKLGIDDVYADLLPQNKVDQVESLLSKEMGKGKLAFVGDGINDAPVLMRADVGIAMGAMGSDAAVEAADIVLMDDAPSKIVVAMRIARKTLSIVYQNIVFALTIKFGVLILAALGLANMWLAVFADVGVAILAILNAMRVLAMGYSKKD